MDTRNQQLLEVLGLPAYVLEIPAWQAFCVWFRSRGPAPRQEARDLWEAFSAGHYANR